MGSPATRRSTMTARSVGVPADSMSNRASSSAETHPAVRSLATMWARELGAGAAFMTPIQDLPVMPGPPIVRTQGYDGSLLIVLHLTHRPNHGVVRVLPSVVSGSALPKQVPALVERTFQPPQLVLLLLGSKLPVLDPSSQLMLLVDQRSDLLENLLFVHDVILAHYFRSVNLDPDDARSTPPGHGDHDPRSRAMGRPLVG